MTLHQKVTGLFSKWWQTSGKTLDVLFPFNPVPHVRLQPHLQSWWMFSAVPSVGSWVRRVSTTLFPRAATASTVKGKPQRHERLVVAKTAVTLGAKSPVVFAGHRSVLITHTLAGSSGSPPDQRRCVLLSWYPSCKSPPDAPLQFAVNRHKSHDVKLF